MIFSYLVVARKRVVISCGTLYRRTCVFEIMSAHSAEFFSTCSQSYVLIPESAAK